MTHPSLYDILMQPTPSLVRGLSHASVCDSIRLVSAPPNAPTTHSVARYRVTGPLPSKWSLGQQTEMSSVGKRDGCGSAAGTVEKLALEFRSRLNFACANALLGTIRRGDAMISLRENFLRMGWHLT